MLPVVAGRFNVCSDEVVQAWIREYGNPAATPSVLEELETRKPS
jgi:hypothetical protein